MSYANEKKKSFFSIIKWTQKMCLIQEICALDLPDFALSNGNKKKSSTNYLYIHIIALSVDPDNRIEHQNCNKMQ